MGMQNPLRFFSNRSNRKKTRLQPRSHTPHKKDGSNERSNEQDFNAKGETLKHPRAFRGADIWRENVDAHESAKQQELLLEKVRQRIHDQVCSTCVDHGYDDRCYSLDPAGCTLNRMLPEIVKAIATVDSQYVKDYVEAIRRRVCVSCPNQDDSGFCEIRDRANCGLNSYLALVIDVVEAVIQEDTTGLGGKN